MSQSKTVIQGLEPGNVNSTNNYGGESSGFYSRSGQSNARGTVVPGMVEHEGGAKSSASQAAQSKPRVINPGKPVVGFLYSVSKTPAGEFWPLQIGRNTIGQGSDADICLLEGTVSVNHAVLVVRQIKNTGGIIAAITDTQSTNGTMLINQTIGFSAVECHNGDIITIGDNYELFLILVDSAKLNLSVSSNFIPVESEDDVDDGADIPNFPGGAIRPGGFEPYDGPSPRGTNGYNPSAGGTVGMDGSMTGDNHGGTIPM